MASTGTGNDKDEKSASGDAFVDGLLAFSDGVEALLDGALEEVETVVLGARRAAADTVRGVREDLESLERRLRGEQKSEPSKDA